MAFIIGDRVRYECENISGECMQGEIVDIATNSGGSITSYFTVLDSGLYIQFKPYNDRWVKSDEPLLVP
ncbi:MAG: hypothetical protein JSU58_10415 [Dehalococcoidales bacterium]|nr:MAG: hypothetical protein JSU58_10415 [Dehalococcoidales bacterium]